MRLFTIVSICVAALLLPSSVTFAQSHTYSLTLSYTTLTVGDTITVSYETDSDNTRSDWIGLYMDDASDSRYWAWKYVDGSSGSLSFTVNQTGTFEFRYFLDNGYERVAVSDSFTVSTEDDDGDDNGDNGDGGGDDGDTGDDTDPEYILSLSTTSIEVGDSITVSYETTSDNTRSDWIGLYRTDSSDSRYITWKYVRTNDELVFTLTETGTFEFRYFIDGGYERVAVSDTFTVSTESDDGDGSGDDDNGGDNGDSGGDDDNGVGDTGPTYSLTLSETSISVGDTITITLDTTSTDTQSDWVGLYRPDSSDSRYITWKYVRTNDELVFTLTETGTFEFRYFVDGGYERVAVSNTFTVSTESDDDDNGGGDDSGDDNGDPNYSLTVSDTTLTVGDSITVSYETTSDNTRSDWIGLYRTDSSDSRYLAWKYVGTDQALVFTVNETGTFEFRYFVGGGYDRVAVSDSVTVSAEDDDGDDNGDDDNGGGDDGDNSDDTAPEYTLSLSTTSIEVGDSITVQYESTAADTNRDWVGLYRNGTSDGNFIAWRYVSGTAGTLTFTVNQTGTFEFRYFLDNGYERVAVSDSFTVSAADDGDDGEDGEEGYSLTTNKTTYQRNEIAQVTWSVPAGETFFLNWIGLYEPGSADTEYISFEYVDFLSRTETFRLDNDGLYEFRFFTKNSYNRVAISDRIMVQNDTTASCDLPTSSITNYPPPTGPIIAFGDSLTAGVGASAGEDYVSELEDRLDVDIINEGVSGDTTRDALARLETDVLSRHPAAVIVFLGGNDEIRRFYEQLSDGFADRNLKDQLDALAERIGYDWMSVPLIPREETFANIESIITQIQATGAVTILVGFDTAIYDATIADDYAAIAESTGSFYVPDIFDGIFGRSRFMSDLVHPNDAGYDFFADRIQPATACVLPDKQVPK